MFYAHADLFSLRVARPKAFTIKLWYVEASDFSNPPQQKFEIEKKAFHQ